MGPVAVCFKSFYFQASIRLSTYNFQIFPEHEQYKIYYAQSLQKSCQYEPAMKASFTVDSPTFKEKVVKLQVSLL